jgi:outer membrane protein OmpA-like peptidoglycan-associated protein
MLKWIFNIILFTWVLSAVIAQQVPRTQSSKALKHFNNAKHHYQFLEYNEAAEELFNAIKIDNHFIDAHLLLAELSVGRKDYTQAIESYRTAIRIDSLFFPNATYSLGHIEFLTGLYEESKQHLELFILQGKGSKELTEKAMKILKNCEFAIKAIKNPVPFKPVNLGSNINSTYDEYWPSLTADGQTLVITVLTPIQANGGFFQARKQEDFFISFWEKGEWTKVKNIGKPLNSNQNEGAQSLSADGHYMFFTACNREGGFGSCDIYYSMRTPKGWSVSVNIGGPINSGSWESQPSISPDGRTLYFASNRPGGKGKMDIWKSTVTKDNYWGEPENLGDNINTPGDEMSPFIHNDNQTLYFSSNGQVGMGGYDLFITKLDKTGNWSAPKNLGYPINTHGDELGLIVNSKGNEAYYSSDRLNNAGKDIFKFDLYNEVRPLEVTYLKGTVYDKDIRNPLVAKFELISLASKEIVMQAFSDQVGEFLVCIPTNMDYALNVSKDGYLFYSDNFSLKGVREITNPFIKDIPLQPLKAGEKVILRNIFYETDSFALKSESEAELDKIIEFLNKNPGIKVEISGHTDNVGSIEYNLTLSENRAKTVYQYLIRNYIIQDRLRYKGYGMSKPLTSNKTEEGRAMNRRTELKILEKK